MKASSCLCLLLTFAAGAAAQPPVRAISGTVSNADGTPARDIRVVAIAIDFGLLSRSNPTQTDDGGAYTIKGLAPGRYLVAAGPQGGPTYYPGTSTPASARAVVLGLVEDVAQVDFGLVAQPLFTIAGRLWPSTGSGRPPYPRLVFAGPAGTSRSADVAADGTFAFTGVAAGTYYLQVDPNPLSLPPFAVTVAQSDVTGVELRVPRAVDITGRVVLDGDGPLPAFSLTFSGPFGGRTARVSPDGRFTLALPPGEHRMLLTGHPSAYAVRTASAGSTDLLTTPLAIEAGQVDEVRIVMTPAPGAAWRRVAGRVIDRGSSGTAPTVVELTSPLLLARAQARPDPDGRFEFAAVPPGSYQIQAGPGDVYAPASITVAGADITDLVVIRPRLVQVTGRIVVDRDRPFPRPSLAFVREHGTIRAGVEQGGRFFATVPEGRHRVVVTGLPEGYFVSAITAGAVDLLRETFLVNDVPPQEIVVSIGVAPAATRASVAGRVIGLESTTTALFTVVLNSLNLLPLEAPVAPDGSFRFASVARGNYTVRLTSSGEPQPVLLPLTIDVGSSDITDVEVRALPLVRVTARVDVDDGLPIPTLSLGFTGPDGFSRSGNDIGIADGLVSTTLPPGEYRVALSGLSRGYTVASLQEGDTDLLTGRLRVVAGRPVEIRVRVRSSLTHVSVSGRIVIRDPADTMPATISLSSASSPGLVGGSFRVLDFGTTLSTPVGPDGSFRFPRVAPGRYDAHALLRGAATSLSTVTVGEDDAHDVEILVPRFVELTARLTVEGGGPPPRPTLMLEDVGNEQTRSIFQGPALATDRVVSMRIRERDGELRVRLDKLPPGYVVRSIRLGDREVSGGTLRLELGMPPLTITVAAPATSAARRIEGRVVNPLTPGATGPETIQLTDQNISQWLEAMIGPDGSFAFPTVLPGTYQVVLLGSGESPLLAGFPGASASDPWGSSLVVGVDDIRDLHIERRERPPRVQVPGRGIVEDGGPQFVPAFFANGAGTSMYVSNASDGQFVLSLPEGEQQISLPRLPEEFVVRSLRYGDTDLLADKATIDAGAVREMQLTLGTRTPRILRSVRGRVIGFERLASRTLRLEPTTGSQTATTEAAPDGTFEFLRMPSGTYRISPGPFTVRQDPSVGSRHLDEIVVGDADVTGLQVLAPYRVPIAFVLDGRDGADDATVPRPSFSRNDAEGRESYGVYEATAMYLQDGDRVTPRPLPPGYRVDAVAFGDTDLLREPVRLAGPPSQGIRVFVSTTPPDPAEPEFTVSGRVIGLVPSNVPQRVSLRFLDYGTVIESAIDADGMFVFTRIGSGKYELRVGDRLPGARVIVSGADVSGVVLRAGP